MRLRELRGRGPDKGDSVESPYDVDARYRRKGSAGWTGYMVHLTEACDAARPRLVLHADTTPADVHEVKRAEPILAALDERGLSASDHLADAAYISADLLVKAEDRYGVRLVGPPRKDARWQALTEGGYTTDRFELDWDRRTATCPEGKTSESWREYQDESGRPYTMVRFGRTDCDACPARDLCTRSERTGRALRLHARREQGALESMRAELTTAEGRRLYGLRSGVEATMSQGGPGHGPEASAVPGPPEGPARPRRDGRSALGRPGRRVARRPACGPDADLALRRPGSLTDFASSVQTVSEWLPVGGDTGGASVGAGRAE